MINLARRCPLNQRRHEGDGFALATEPFLPVWSVQARDPARLEPLVAPPPTGRVVEAGGVRVAGIAPREWLLIGVDAAALAVRADAALAGTAALVLDLTHGTAALALSGPSADARLAALTPFPFAALPQDGCARSLLGGLHGYFERTGAGWRILVARPEAAAAWRSLTGADA